MGEVRTRKWATIGVAAGVVIAMACLAASCRGKEDPPVGPNGPGPGDPWRLYLIHPETLYLDTITHRVNNDTIKVRLYNPQGTLASGVIIYCRADGSPNSVTAAVTSKSDTIVRPWGSDPALMYWGSGIPGEPDAPEVIRCAAVQSGDTVARATTSFYLRNQPPG